MIRVGEAFARAGVHQARQARQHPHRRIDAARVELVVEHDLSLGDVAGQVGDRMADVAARRRKDVGSCVSVPARPRMHPARSYNAARSEYVSG